MASTYENDLRLEEMATGENSGSWGTKTNNNLELVADAFSYGTEIIANADTAITIADGAADAARSLALKITSSENLTTTRVITLGPNTVSKVWIIENNTSGGQTLTISAGSGSNVTLPNGVTKIIATDGIGAAANVTELYTNLHNITIDGILTVDGILSLADGSNSAPSLTNTGDTNTGLYFPAADEVGITTGGTQRVKVDSTGVDITGTLVSDGLTVDGTTPPVATLNSTSNGVRIDFNGASTPSSRPWEVGVINNADGDFQIYQAADVGAGDIKFYTDGVLRQNIDAQTGDITFYDASGNASFVYDESAGSTFNEHGADRDFRVESDSNANALFVNAGSNRIIFGGTDTVNSADVEFLLGSGVSETPYVSIRNNATGTLTTSASARLDIGTWTNNGAYPNASNSYTGKLLFLAQGTDDAYAAGGIESYLKTAGNRTRANTDSQLRFSVKDLTSVSAVEYFRLSGDEKSAVFNETGVDQDFRVESDSQTHALFVDALNNTVGVGTSSVSSTVAANFHGKGILFRNNVNGDNTNWTRLHNTASSDRSNLLIQPSTGSVEITQGGGLTVNNTAGYGTIFNSSGVDADFRVESSSNQYAFFLDAGNNVIGTGTSTPATYVSGGGLAIKGSTKSDLSLVASSVSAGDNSHQIRYWNEAGASYEIARTRVNVGAGQVNRGEYQFAVNNGAGLRRWLDVNYSGDVVFNADAHDSDFRVSSDTNSYCFFVDAGANFVSIGASSPSYNSMFNVSSGTNTTVASFESALGGAGAAAHVYVGVSTRSSNGLRLSSNGSSASVNGGALAANVVNSENASLYLGANNALKAELDVEGRFSSIGGIGYSLQSIAEPSSQLAAKVTSASSISYDCVLDSSTGDWSSGYVYIKASTVNSNQAGAAAAWWLYHIMHYNGTLSGASLKDSGGDTGSFTITISDQSGTDPITVRVNIAHSNNRLTTMIDVGNYYGIVSIT